MKHHLITVIVAIIVAIATFLVTTAFIPHEAAAPTAPTQNAPQNSAVIPMNIVSIRETASTSPTVTVEYPQFPSLPADLNEAIASATMSRLDQWRSDLADNEAARKATSNGNPSAIIPPSSYDFIASWQPAQVNASYVSFIERYESFSGGANENQDLQTFNYDVAHKKMLGLANLFGSNPNYLSVISKSARAQLSDSLSAASPGYDPTTMLDPGTEPTLDNFSDFTFTNYLVTFYFPKYVVAPGSFGEQQATIPRSSL